jgi:hypothetical protein
MNQWTKDTLSRIASLFAIYVLVMATFYVLPPGHGQAINNGAPAYVTGLDACAASSSAPSNATVSITTATTTQIVALSAGKQIFLCEWTFTINSSATTASSALFEFGTGASCGTGTTTLTGAMGTENAAAGPGLLLVNGPFSGSTLVVPAGNALCIVTAGTTVALHGQVTFKQL